MAPLDIAQETNNEILQILLQYEKGIITIICHRTHFL